MPLSCCARCDCCSLTSFGMHPSVTVMRSTIHHPTLWGGQHTFIPLRSRPSLPPQPTDRLASLMRCGLVR